MRVNLSPAAIKELIAIGTHRQGATNANMSTDAVMELQRAGLVGPGAGLTRRGTIARARFVDAALDALF